MNTIERKEYLNKPKLILTLDEDPDADYEGIRRLNALNWLMGLV